VNFRRKFTAFQSTIGISCRVHSYQTAFIFLSPQITIMKQCVITGCSGLIGSHLVKQLSQDWKIFCVARSSGKPIATAQNPQSVMFDLSQTWDSHALPAQIDAVIHLAQSEHFRDFPEKAEHVFQVNTVSTLRLLDYARQAGARTFIFASSGGIYGHGEQEFSEDNAISSQGDLGFYLGTKLCAEILAENYTAFMNVIVLRFFFVYGVGQRRTMLIPRLVQSVLDERPIVLHGQDGIRINPTDVGDAVGAITRALALDGSHKINIGGPEILSLRQIGRQIGAIIGKEPVFEVRPTVAPHHLVGDIRKMAQVLAPPKIKFEQGIAAYIRATYGDSI
jgi:nucleoside-diphosphate-sugar epimerase